MITIEKDIAMPERTPRSGIMTTLRALNVGDGFRVRANAHSSANIHGYARRINIRVRVAKQGLDVLVKRIA